MTPQDPNQLLITASENGDVEQVRNLLAHATELQRDLAVVRAALAGQLECVQALIPYATSSGRGEALVMAVDWNRLSCVKLLIPLSEPKYYYNALLAAIQHDYVESAQLLLPLADPTINNNWMVVCAAAHQQSQMLDLLLDVCDPQAAIASMRDHNPDDKDALMLLEEKASQRQNARLRAQVAPIETTGRRRKI